MVSRLSHRAGQRQTLNDRAFEWLVHAVLFMVLLLMVLPLWFVVVASFSAPIAVMQGRVTLLPVGFHVDAYRRVFAHEDIMRGYGNTLVYTLLGTALNMILTVCAAYPLSRRDFVGRNALTLFFSFTMFFSGGLIPGYLNVKGFGMINTLWAMILPGAMSVYNMVIMRSYFQRSIPLELYEAASLDGCGNFRMLASVVLPLSGPILAVLVLYYAVGHWNQWFNALLYLTDVKRYPLQLVLRAIIAQNDVQRMMDMSAETLADQVLVGESIKYAVILVASVPMLLLYPFVQRFFVKGVMVGAIKG